jgi:hypothetical protein
MILWELDRTASADAVIITSAYKSGLMLAQQVEDWTMVEGLDIVVTDGTRELKRIAAPGPASQT